MDKVTKFILRILYAAIAMTLWCLFGRAFAPDANPEIILITCAIVASGTMAGST